MPLELKRRRVFVAGETGLVGRALTQKLRTAGCHIISAPHADLDLTDQAQTYDWFETHRPEIVVVAAARVGGILDNVNAPADFIADNLSIALNVIQAAHRTHVQKLLYLGSSCIYPKQAENPITEDVLLTGALEETNAPYALAKIAGIKLCQSYRSQYGCHFISVMPTNLYGPYDNFDIETGHVIPALISKFHAAKDSGQEAISMIGTGTALREFLYVDDLAEALCVCLAHYDDAAPINIGSGQEVSIQALAHIIAKTVGYDGDILFDGTGPDGVARKLLDSSKIRALGWAPQTELMDGLAATYHWFLENHNKSQKT